MLDPTNGISSWLGNSVHSSWDFPMHSKWVPICPSPGPLLTVFTTELPTNTSQVSFPWYTVGGYTTDTIGVTPQDYKILGVQARCVQAPSSKSYAGVTKH